MSNQAQKTKVSDQAIQDIINLIELTPPFIMKVLKILKGILPLLDDGNEEQAVQAANQSLNKIWNGISETSFAQRLIRELDHYYNKRAVVEATLVYCRDICNRDSSNEVM